MGMMSFVHDYIRLKFRIRLTSYACRRLGGLAPNTCCLDGSGFRLALPPLQAKAWRCSSITGSRRRKLSAFVIFRSVARGNPTQECGGPRCLDIICAYIPA